MASRDDLYAFVWADDTLRGLALQSDAAGLLAALNAASVPVASGAPITAIEIISRYGLEAADAMAAALQAAAAGSPSLTFIVQGIAVNGFQPTNEQQAGLINTLVGRGVLTTTQRDMLLALASENKSPAQITLGRTATADDAAAVVAWAQVFNTRPRVVAWTLTIEHCPADAPTLDRLTYVFNLSNGGTAGPFVHDATPADEQTHRDWVAAQAAAFDQI